MAASKSRHGGFSNVTNADSRFYVLHCLIWNDRRLEAAQAIQRHIDEGRGLCQEAGKRGQHCFLSAGGLLTMTIISRVEEGTLHITTMVLKNTRLLAQSMHMNKHLR